LGIGAIPALLLFILWQLGKLIACHAAAAPPAKATPAEAVVS
jgi:hypothetical protein